jgi:predicted extracellular nuclease
MKSLFTVLSFIILFNISFAQTKPDTLFVAHWNLENLFDAIDDPEKNDEEFLNSSEKEWTEERLEKKIYNLSRIISSMNNNNGPDILGVCEVEHQSLLDTMINKYLFNMNYKISYMESPDGRGIDNGLIYNSKIFSVLSVKGLQVNLDDGYKTRLILYTKLLSQKADTIHFFVNHWPSRRGGEDKSEVNRISAATTLRRTLDSLYNININSKIIIVGDFNDEPVNISINDYLKAKPFFCDTINLNTFREDNETDLFNCSYAAFYNEQGSYKYKDDFNMLDQIIISKNLLIGNNITYVCNSFEVFKPSLMVTRTGKFQGSPFPTYGGSRYLGGYSDHFPVTAKFIINKN